VWGKLRCITDSHSRQPPTRPPSPSASSRASKGCDLPLPLEGSSWINNLRGTSGRSDSNECATISARPWSSWRSRSPRRRRVLDESLPTTHGVSRPSGCPESRDLCEAAGTFRSGGCAVNWGRTAKGSGCEARAGARPGLGIAGTRRRRSSGLGVRVKVEAQRPRDRTRPVLRRRPIPISVSLAPSAPPLPPETANGRR
jgi:hypothetical protein